MTFVSIVLGAVLIGLFVYSNFYLDEKWLSPANAGGSATTRQASIRRARILRGSVEAALFGVGVTLICAGLAKVGINAGYGGF